MKISVSLLAAALLLTAHAPVFADDRTPPIPAAALPVVGTCAPLETADVTHVGVGVRTDVRWFQVSGEAQPVEFPRLVELFKARAGRARPSSHTVWITASAKHAWVHAIRVRQACAQAGIYRVGLRVRSEATGQVMGFPLFLPPGASGRSSGKAGRLQVRINTLGAAQAKAPSDVGHIYAAARRAQEQRGKFGVDQITANLWIATNTPLQYALTAIDSLYRAGCAGVKLRSGVRLPRLQFEAVPIVEIQGGMVSRHPQGLKPAGIQPRTRPWGLNGAAQPGWVDLTVQDLPVLDGSAEAAPTQAAPRPNYAAQPAGVPPHVMDQVEAGIRAFSGRFGSDLLKAVRADKASKKRFAIGLRRKEELPAIIKAVRSAFPDATRVVPSTIQLNVFLFAEGKIRGRADLTLNLAGRRLGLIFGRWLPLDPSRRLNLAPFPVDPFAGGEAADFRIWTEGVFHAARRGGAAALPLADAAEVAPFFPAVARPGVTRAIQARGAELQRLAAELARTPCDRVVLAVARGTATVFAGARVVGILNYGLRAEESELRLDALTPRRVR